VILCDVNVLLSAAIEGTPHHRVCREALHSLLAGPEPHAVSELVLAAVVRIGTNPKIWKPVVSTDDAFAFVNSLRTHRRATVITPGPRHWRIFEDLVSSLGITGSDTTDAYFAALAQEHACEWWTTDKGFARFPGLRYRNLLGR
jgi:toxin-antitoxin system PIN domain toxin